MTPKSKKANELEKNNITEDEDVEIEENGDEDEGDEGETEDFEIEEDKDNDRDVELEEDDFDLDENNDHTSLYTKYQSKVERRHKYLLKNGYSPVSVMITDGILWRYAPKSGIGAIHEAHANSRPPVFCPCCNEYPVGTLIDGIMVKHLIQKHPDLFLSFNDAKNTVELIRMEINELIKDKNVIGISIDRLKELGAPIKNETLVFDDPNEINRMQGDDLSFQNLENNLHLGETEIDEIGIEIQETEIQETEIQESLNQSFLFPDDSRDDGEFLLPLNINFNNSSSNEYNSDHCDCDSDSDSDYCDGTDPDIDLISSRDEITPDPIITHKNTRNRIRKSLNKH